MRRPCVDPKNNTWLFGYIADTEQTCCKCRYDLSHVAGGGQLVSIAT